MSTYYSGEDEKRMSQKEKLSPKKDASNSTSSEENVARSDIDKDQTMESVDAENSKRSGTGEGLEQKDLDAEEPE